MVIYYWAFWLVWLYDVIQVGAIVQTNDDRKIVKIDGKADPYLYLPKAQGVHVFIIK